MPMNYLFLSITHITFSVVKLTIFTLLAGITALLSLFEDISSVLFELASDSSGVPPRSSFPTEKCAVLILGAQEGVGRNAALHFSELGYTVFALCPNRQDDAGHIVSPGGSRGVASLLYIWHNRKERSRSIPWGLVAPMQLNMWSRSQRQAVHETVSAHCNAYDLRLVALIISHDSKSHPGTGPLPMDALDATVGTHESHLEEDAWRNIVLDDVTEPVLMAYDYRELLAEASGRIIVLSNFADSTPLALLSLASRTATAESLANMLELEGIRVSSIYFGPLARDSMAQSPDGHGNDRHFPQSFDWQGLFDTLAQKISRKLIVQDSLLLTVLRRVVQSRHPKFVYTVGLYPVLHVALRSAPVGSRLAATSLIRWAMLPERASE
ncbi:hypothetical protein EDB83DRAFT_1273031 [Lactarius deliciosus]|nr:hypothetical protein EDB83DRAFT_1273031 [Lactarius deliciosus]